jgi:hypothetical protein
MGFRIDHKTSFKLGIYRFTVYLNHGAGQLQGSADRGYRGQARP